MKSDPLARESVALQRVKDAWQRLGEEDPLWAVASWADKRGGRWQLDEFLATGEGEVGQRHAVFRDRASAPERFQHVLDFGCGVGRLTLAWSKRADYVTGVDISAAMIEKGRRILSGASNAELVLHTTGDLACFGDGQFDLVFSLICLQHMPWALTRSYMAEFARVARPGGWVAFQLPARPLVGNHAANLRKWAMEKLPRRFREAWRKNRHGTSVAFEMYFTPAADVIETASRQKLSLVLKEPDGSAGREIESFFYVFRRDETSFRPLGIQGDAIQT